jgi:predicted metal-dependent hydrolase
MNELERAEDLFNQGEFFAAHEVFEAVWMTAQGRQKTVLQGLIQAAAGFHKIKENEWGGGAKLLRRAIAKLEGMKGPAELFKKALEECAEKCEKGTLSWKSAPKMKLVPREGIEPTRP